MTNINDKEKNIIKLIKPEGKSTKNNIHNDHDEV